MPHQISSLPRSGFAGYAKAFWLCALTGALFVVPFSLMSGGVYYLGSDYVEQQLPFWSYCNAAVKSGNVLWTNSIDLGSSFVGAFAFYGLGSPFFWLSLLAPAQVYPLLGGTFLVLKMAVAGTTAFAWLRQYAKQENWAVLGGVLYAFSGWQISNMNYHFYDATALFPLLLLALDAAMQRDRRGWFALSTALLALTNFVFFPSEVIFLLLYFCVRLWCGQYTLTAKRFGRLALESVCGFGLSAALTLPAALYTAASPRVEGAAGFESVASLFLLKPIYWAELIRGMLFPAECIFNRGYFLKAFTNGGELYLPVFGMILAAAYCLTHRKSWEARLLGVCALFAVVPVLNSSFVLFNSEYYTRWFFMPILILCLATVRALDETNLPLRRGWLFYGGLWAAFGVLYCLFRFVFQAAFFYNLVIVAVFAAIALAGAAVTACVRRLQKARHGAALLLACVVLCSAACGAVNTYYHQKTRTPQAVKALYTAQEQITLPETEEGYRISSQYQFMNLGVMLDEATVTDFSSSIAPKAFRFYKEALGQERTVISLPDASDYAYRSFTSARYWIGCLERVSGYDETLFSSLEDQGDYEIATYRYAIPMGYTFACAMTQEQLETVPQAERSKALLKALVLTDEQRAAYGLPLLADEELTDTSFAAFENDVEARSAESCSSFVWNRSGFAAAITLAKDNLVFFSIPYDEGWSAVVNGTPAAVEEVDCGLMAVPAQAGENEIVLHYWPKGLTVGLCVTAVSMALLVLYVVWGRRRKLSRKGGRAG